MSEQATRPTAVDPNLRLRIRDPEAGRVSLLLYHGGTARVVPIASGRPVVVGRDASASVTIDEESLSRRHASFTLRGDQVWVEDLGSTNGTQLNGERISAGAVPVQPGDEIRMGTVSASVHVLARLERRRPGAEVHDRFLTLLEDEAVRASTFRRPLALVMLREPRAEIDLAAAVELLRTLLRPVDRLAVYSPDTLEALLPETTRERALEQARAIVEAPGLRELGLLCGIAVLPDCGSSADELLAVCRAALRDAAPAQPIRVAPAAGDQPEPPDRPAPGPVVGNAEMLEIYATLERLASSVIPVLLIGETGTGKEVLARAIQMKVL